MKPSKLTLQRVLVGAASLTAAYIAVRAVQNAYRFRVTHHERTLPKLNKPLRIVQLSDLHIGPFVSYTAVREWVNAANAQRPDLIVITGDFVDQWFGRDLTTLTRVFSELRAPLGVWGVWGNHDHARFVNMRRLEASLNRSSTYILNNEGVSLREDLFLAGVDDMYSAPDLSLALRDQPPEAACILLSHNPDFIPRIPDGLRRGVDLTLCGHTHGGQISLPGLGPVFTSSAHGQRFAAGWVEEPKLVRAYVSRGLGSVILPARLGCPAEIAVFDLLPER